jgi:hypothetical protein
MTFVSLQCMICDYSILSFVAAFHAGCHLSCSLSVSGLNIDCEKVKLSGRIEILGLFLYVSVLLACNRLKSVTFNRNMYVNRIFYTHMS